MNIAILLATDDDYVPYLAATLASVLVNSAVDEVLDVYIAEFTAGISEENKLKLAELRSIKEFSINYIEIAPEKVEGFASTVHTANMYLRLFVPEHLTALKKIIYLDCDMIIRGSLRELSQTELGSSLFGAVLDSSAVFREGEVWEYEKAINPQYFNSGMLLMNLDALRRADFTGSIQRWLQRARELLFPDQDALNTLYSQDTKIMPLRYNAQFPLLAACKSGHFSSETDEYSELSDPVIVHFCTQQKPWLYSAEPPYKDEFNYYLSLTPWRDLKPVDYTFKNILKKNCRRILRKAGLKRV